MADRRGDVGGGCGIDVRHLFGPLASVDAYLDRKSNESESEAFVRGFASSMAALASAAFLADKMGPYVARMFAGDPDAGVAAMSGAVVEIGMAGVTGDLWDSPWKTLSNIGVNAGISYAAARLGASAASNQADIDGVRELLESAHANVYGWVGARINDLIWSLAEQPQ